MTVLQTQTNSSPATMSDRAQAAQEELQSLDSRADVSLRAFSREVEELHGWMTQSIEGHSAQAAREFR